MNAVFSISGREAISVQMLPYVTNWKAAPDELARSFAEPTETAVAGTFLSVANRNALPSYVKTDDGEFREMAPEEWGSICVEIDCLAKKLTADERCEGENWADWRRRATGILPSSAFVWLDEFQSWFTRTRQLKVIKGVDFSVEQEDEEGATPSIGKESDRLELHPVMPDDAVPSGMSENASPSGASRRAGMQPETSAERKERIDIYVNTAYAKGQTKTSAFTELAKEDGCQPGTIRAIYARKATPKRGG